jgi:hypothetical protein
MDINRVYVNMDVNTKYSPKHWKTVASMTTYMAGAPCSGGRRCDTAAEKSRGGYIEMPARISGSGRRKGLHLERSLRIPYIQGFVHGYQYENGNSVEGQILGRGSFIMSDLNILNKETGKGKAGPYWTVGAQAIEIEFDTKEYTTVSLKPRP